MSDGPRWENAADYLAEQKAKYPLTWEIVRERNEDMSELLDSLVRGAYIDGRLDGIEALAQRMRENRNESGD